MLDRILAGTRADQQRPQLREHLEAGTDARAERYWQLLGIINGWPPFQTHVPAFRVDDRRPPRPPRGLRQPDQARVPDLTPRPGEG